MITVNSKTLMSMGYSKSTAQNIIRQAKHYMVNRGFELYNNRRLGQVPTHAVESILGFELSKGGALDNEN